MKNEKWDLEERSMIEDEGDVQELIEQGKKLDESLKKIVSMGSTKNYEEDMIIDG